MPCLSNPKLNLGNMDRRTNTKSFQKKVILRSSLVFVFLFYVPKYTHMYLIKKGKSIIRKGIGKRQKRKELLNELETKGNLVGQRKGSPS